MKLPFRVVHSLEDCTKNFDYIRNTFEAVHAMTARDTQTVDNVYGNEERDVINNLRVRVNELEAIVTSLKG